MIALLHTSPVHISRFDKLLEKLGIDQPVKHFVNEKILKKALETGKIDQEGFNEEIKKIQKESPELIICTCSTFGAACDLVDGVERIDRPIAEYLVKKYASIAIAYTAISTKESSFELVKNTAKRLKKDLSIIEIDCTAFWSYFESGETETYYQKIANNIISTKKDAEAIFLAQASMEPTIAYLSDIGIEVVSSPEYGMKEILRG